MIFSGFLKHCQNASKQPSGTVVYFGDDMTIAVHTQGAMFTGVLYPANPERGDVYIVCLE